MNQDSSLETPKSTLGTSSMPSPKQEGKSKGLQENLVSIPGPSNSLFPYGALFCLKHRTGKSFLRSQNRANVTEQEQRSVSICQVLHGKPKAGAWLETHLQVMVTSGPVRPTAGQRK